MSQTWTYAFGLAALAVVMAWLYGMIDYAGAFASVDLRHYRAMAQAAPDLADVPRPFAHRLLGPYLVGLLPMADPTGFRLLTTGALVALTLGLYGFLLRFGLAPPVAAFTTALLPLNPYIFGFPAFNPFQLGDVLAMALIVLAFRVLLDRRWGLYALALVLGALTREPVLLVIPAALVFVYERGLVRSDAGRWLLASLPALLAFVLLRIAVPANGPDFVTLLVDHASKASDPRTWYRLLVNAWAPLSLLPLVFWRTTLGFVRTYAFLVVFAAFVLLSALFGGDQERLVAPAFVAVYALVGTIIARHLRTYPWTLGVIALAAFGTSLHHLTARFLLPSRTWTIALSLAALALVMGAGLFVRWREGAARGSAT